MSKHTEIRMSKSQKASVVFVVAHGWLKFCQEKLAEGKSPAKLSKNVREQIVAVLDDVLLDADLYYVTGNEITRMGKAAVESAKEMMWLPRFADVKNHFAKVNQDELAARKALRPF